MRASDLQSLRADNIFIIGILLPIISSLTSFLVDTSQLTVDAIWLPAHEVSIVFRARFFCLESFGDDNDVKEVR